MSTAGNRVELAGSVQGATWLSYGRGQQGRVNFWLAVGREVAGEGYDLLHCAGEPRSGEELLRLERELREGRGVRLVGRARSLINPEARLSAQAPGVIFVAESLEFEGGAPVAAARRAVPPARRVRHVGKAAAGHDYPDDGAEAGSEIGAPGVGEWFSLEGAR